mgnify:CR=1 FL=1
MWFFKKLSLRQFWLTLFIPALILVFFANTWVSLSLHQSTLKKIETQHAEKNTAQGSKNFSESEQAVRYQSFRLKSLLFATLSAIALAILFLLITSPAVTIIKQLSDMINDMARGEGDLTKRIQLEWENELGLLASGFNRFVENQQQMIRQLKGTIELVQSGADAIAEAAEMVSAGAEEQLSQLSEVAASIEQISAMILETSTSASDTEDSANRANEMAKINEQSQAGQRNASESGKVLNEIVDAIHSVKRAMSQIASAANEQSAGAEEISKNVEAVTTVSQDAAMSAQELSTAGEELRREIKAMEEMVHRFKV